MFQFINNVTEQYKDKLKTPFFGAFVFWWFVFHVEEIYDLLFIHKLTKNTFNKAKSICIDNSICNSNFNELNQIQKELLLIDYKRLLFSSLFEFSLSNLLRIIGLTLFSLFMFYVFKAITFYFMSLYMNKAKPEISKLTNGKYVEQYRFKNLEYDFNKIEKENSEIKDTNVNYKKTIDQYEKELNNYKSKEKDNIKIIQDLETYKQNITTENLKQINFEFFLFIIKYFDLQLDYFFENSTNAKIPNEKFERIENFLKHFKFEIPKFKLDTVDKTKEWVFDSSFSNQYNDLIRDLDYFLKDKEEQIIFKDKNIFENVYFTLKSLIKFKNNDNLHDELPF